MCNSFFFLMMRRPPRSTQSRSSAASDVYKRQDLLLQVLVHVLELEVLLARDLVQALDLGLEVVVAVSYTHLRAHETVLDLVCRLLLEKKNNIIL